MLRRSLALVLAGVLAAAPTVPSARAQDDWDVKANPFDPRIVNGYKALLEKNPNDGPALKKLVALYGKYSTVDKLVAEYEAKAQKKPDAWQYPMILGHIHRARGDLARAVAAYDKAASLNAGEPSAALALAELHRQAGRRPEATAAYEKALGLEKDAKKKKVILRALADLALEVNDIDRARGYFKQYLALDPRDVGAQIELGEALAKHGHHDEALVELAAAEKKLSTDPARRVDVLAKIGASEQALGKDDAAVATYRRAMELTQKGHYLRKELTERIIDIYRKKQDLRALLAYYEKTWPAGGRGHFEWDILARLYEEAGETDKAMDAYKKAVKAAPFELDTQRRLIAMLERAGKDAEALAQYEAVIRVAPGEPRFQLELAERYWRAGQRAKAVELAKKIAGRFPDDGGVHAALADLYSRWGEDGLAMREYEVLTRIEPDDQTHLVNLGEQHFQRGDKARAIEIWKRIAVSKTPEAYARLAEVYAEHDMGAEAIDMYLKAIALAPKDPNHQRGLAGVFERQRQDDRAVEAWEKVMELTRDQAAQKPLRREARTRIIAILARKQGGPLTRKAMEWDRKFQANPPDMEAGYFAAEAYTKQGRYEDAERVLLRVLKLAPDDLDAMHQLVAVYKSLRRYRQAIDLLKVLADKSPGREREYYAQISELELALYNDEEALTYATKALEKSPNDPQAQERLAEIHETRAEYDQAIAAYKRAIELSPRTYKTYFALARLHVRFCEPKANMNHCLEAARLYRDVLRRAGDEDTVRQAARKAMDLEEWLQTLGDLERDIVPLVFTYGQKPFYRRILVEIYDRYVPWLWARARRGDVAAKKELAGISEHGLRPLLEALGDRSDPAQQRIAVTVLGYLGNKNAAGPLVRFALEKPAAEKADDRPAPPGAAGGVRPAPRLPGAVGEDEGPAMDLRVEALVAAGRLGDGRVVPELAALLAQKEKALREAAAWALGRSGDPRAVGILIGALDDGQASVQVLACLGLGRLGDRRGLAAASAHLDKSGVASEARAACAYALGVAGHAPAVDDLLAVLATGNDDVQRKAAWALGRIGDKRAVPALLEAYFGKRDNVRVAIGWALARLAGSKAEAEVVDDEPVVEHGKIDLRRLVRGLPGDLVDARVPASVLSGRGAAIARGLSGALARHRDVQLRVLRDLDARPDGLALGALTADLPSPLPDEVRTLLADIADKLEPRLVELAGGKDAELRRYALSVLAKSGRDAALAVLDKGLGDDDARVRMQALVSVPIWVKARGKSPDATRLRDALAARLAAPRWEERAEAARSLGVLDLPGTVAALAVTQKDRSEWVREAGAVALGRLGGADAEAALLAYTRDECAEVRLAAVVALGPRPKSEPARARLAELASGDPDPAVRAAAAKK